MLIIAVDWSGAKKPYRKLALAEVVDGQLQQVTTTFRSREEVTSEIIRRCQAKPDTFVGLDFAFSMPTWFLAEHGIFAIEELWRLAEREGETWLRECSPPFWGRPGKCRPQLEQHLRVTEAKVGSIEGISPKSVFQIGGAGAVGTGSIRGMPMLLRLREAGISVWPFDPPKPPLVVEIYPRMLTGSVKKRSLDARMENLERKWGFLPLDVRQDIARSEDTFDAAVSALVMDRCRSELEQLPFIEDNVQRLEGMIWPPPGAMLPKVPC